MSKAKQFIEDYTRGCSNELCAVEDRYGKKVISYHEWLTPEQARRAVEIEREEILQKVYDFFKGIGDWDYPAERMIQDFKKYTKGDKI